MGLDTFPLLQDQTYLIAYRNTVFKLKLEYQHVSQQMKEAFVQVVSERAAHCQIEDVCRAVLYNIEREEPLSPIQSEHFVIYPEVHRWPLANKVQFFVHGKQLSCHQNLILLKLFSKGHSVSVPDQSQVEASSSGKPGSPRPSHDTSQTSRCEESDKKNTSTSCPGDTDIKKSSSEVVSSELVHSMLNKLTTLQEENMSHSEIPYNNNSKTEQLYSSDLQTYQDVCASNLPRSLSALYGEKPAHDQHEVIYETNNKVMSKRITRSELRKRYSYNNLMCEGFITSDKCVSSQKNSKVTSINPHQTHMVRSVKTNLDSTGLTQVSKQKYTCGRKQSAQTCDTIKHSMRHKGTCHDMKQHSSLEISDMDVVEISEDGKTLCESKKIIYHGRDMPVCPPVTLRKRKQNSSAKYPDANRHQVCRYRSQSAESGKTRRLSGKVRKLSGKARRLSGPGNSTDIVYERRQIKGHDALPASRSSSDSSQISVRSRRIATKYNFLGERRASQSKYEASFKKKITNLEAKEQVTFDSRNKVGKNKDSRRKSLSCDSLKRTTRSYSVSSLSGETDTTSRSSHSRRKVLSLSPDLSTKRGHHVPEALAEAHQHLLEAKDGVWLFWKSGKSSY